MAYANKRPIMAHRLYYERVHGPIPVGLQIDHLCRNRCCVNPDHLEAVTPSVNQRRGNRAKLTEDQVVYIRAHVGTESQSAMARRFGVSVACVNNLIHGKSWRERTN